MEDDVWYGMVWYRTFFVCVKK